MITEKAMREVELMIEAARLGGRPALSLELREALIELVSYYKVGHEVADDMRLFIPKDGLPRLEVTDDGETWRPLEQGSTAHNSLQLAEQVGELNGAAPAAAEPCDHAVTRLDDAGDLRCIACGSPFGPEPFACVELRADPPEAYADGQAPTPGLHRGLELGVDFDVRNPGDDRPRFQGSCIFGLPYVPGRATIHGLPEDGE